RWVQADPIEYATGDLNLYRAWADSPINRTDPRGLDAYQSQSYQGQGYMDQLYTKQRTNQEDEVPIYEDLYFKKPSDQIPAMNQTYARWGMWKWTHMSSLEKGVYKFFSWYDHIDFLADGSNFFAGYADTWTRFGFGPYSFSLSQMYRRALGYDDVIES